MKKFSLVKIFFRKKFLKYRIGIVWKIIIDKIIKLKNNYEKPSEKKKEYFKKTLKE